MTKMWQRLMIAVFASVARCYDEGHGTSRASQPAE
jgi:hypothetical protein